MEEKRGSKPKFPYCKQTVLAVEQYVLAYIVSAQQHRMARKIKSQSILHAVILPLLEFRAEYVPVWAGSFGSYRAGCFHSSRAGCHMLDMQPATCDLFIHCAVN